MTTLVCFHAHPDDESISTGGVMALAADRGHRVVLVAATRGEHGEVPDGYLAPGELLRDRRTPRPKRQPRCSASAPCTSSTTSTRG